MFDPWLSRILLSIAALANTSVWSDEGGSGIDRDGEVRHQAIAAMEKATAFFSEQVARHGGYVYLYTADLQQRWGEGEATEDQIWVQPPGTPTVGLAFLEAYDATKSPQYLAVATRAGEALVYGQLVSGGWANCIDFDPQGERVARYRHGRGRGRNHSSLDDGQTQSALTFLIRLDKALDHQHAAIAEAIRTGLDALYDAQFPHGGFPQGWDGPVPQDIVPQPASYPPYDWRTEGRIKNYWDMPTINDNVPGYVAETLITAIHTMGEQRAEAALRKLGDFLVLVQMPAPQSGWAQQYDFDMHPIWARKFEPPAIASDETQEVIETLMTIYEVTGDAKYLEPIPRALRWLEESLLPDGRLARYYELHTNRPLYMRRQGDRYDLTYDDTNLPDHYAWKIGSRIERLSRTYERLRTAHNVNLTPPRVPTVDQVRRIIDRLDSQGRWIETFDGQRLPGQPKLSRGQLYLSSETFAKNITTLARYVAATTDSPAEQ
ncbi:MAG: polysaccharide lyase [Pirellulaceae bacterium]|nr:MAG: polysaccharide lyase [Pirellulaceae bacterium]